ncbi:MAG TPA: hypothetical protein VFX97_17090 [Pyrinomonadaceae bacterium]|nr:hypothetical protein [Pyrinomonadaceae bacterium]
MRCINGCVIKESELDDAVEIEGRRLMCASCVNKLWPQPQGNEAGDQRGRFTGRMGRKCYNPSFGTIGSTR